MYYEDQDDSASNIQQSTFELLLLLLLVVLVYVLVLVGHVHGVHTRSCPANPLESRRGVHVRVTDYCDSIFIIILVTATKK